MLQQELAERGYYTGSIDGVWGPMTTTAIQQYQSSMGLPATGTLTTSMLNDLGVQVSSDTRGLGDISPAAGDDGVNWNEDTWENGTGNTDTNMNTDMDNDVDMNMDSDVDSDWNSVTP
jgi:peptidoglycan hydrolase-like protein with peptidoglycan-binding domain